MTDASNRRDRTRAAREADHASLALLSETLIPALVAKLNASGLGELEVREGDWRIRLRRPAVVPAGGQALRRAERGRHVAHATERDVRIGRDTTPAPDAATAARAPGPEADDHRSIATSPAVGVFRPDTLPGTRVRAGDRLGIVDLLGIPQDVVALVDGIVVDVLAEPGEAVEYGEPVVVVESEPAVEPDRPASEGDG